MNCSPCKFFFVLLHRPFITTIEISLPPQPAYKWLELYLKVCHEEIILRKSSLSPHIATHADSSVSTWIMITVLRGIITIKNKNIPNVFLENVNFTWAENWLFATSTVVKLFSYSHSLRLSWQQTLLLCQCIAKLISFSTWGFTTENLLVTRFPKWWLDTSRLLEGSSSKEEHLPPAQVPKLELNQPQSWSPASLASFAYFRFRLRVRPASWEWSSSGFWWRYQS